MFIDASTYIRNGKTYRRVLLRNSYRVDGKVHHDTIANLSSCSDQEVSAIKLALKHKNNLNQLSTIEQSVTLKQGLAVGSVWTLNEIAKKLQLNIALGQTRIGKLSLWLIMACIIEQGSRLSAVRLAQRHNACDILGLDGFNENDLYESLDYLAERQTKIEQQLFNNRYKGKIPSFYLYDVTSSYFEGTENELANYGYNRDKKSGKKQIVIGLMTDNEGTPIAIEVFEGNTQDPKTVHNQIEKMANRFGVKEVTFVGDRGMIKQAQITELNSKSYHYITAITKPQIEMLIKDGPIELSLFSKKLVEVQEDGIRYILHRNPIRAEEIVKSRESKLACLKELLNKKNKYLEEHGKAKLETALRDIKAKASKLKIDSWITIESTKSTDSINNDERKINVVINQEELTKESRLDGCYVIKTDLSSSVATTEEVHDRYKSIVVPFVKAVFHFF